MSEEKKRKRSNKPYSHKEVSDRLCRNCGKPLKLNLLFKRPNANLDWHCYELTVKGKTTYTRTYVGISPETGKRARLKQQLLHSKAIDHARAAYRWRIDSKSKKR